MVFKFFYGCKYKYMNVFICFMYEERINVGCLLSSIWLLVFNRSLLYRIFFGILVEYKLV